MSKAYHPMKTYAALSFLFIISFYCSSQVPKNVIKEFERIQPGARFVDWKEEWSKVPRGGREKVFRVTYTNWYRQTVVFNKKGEILLTGSELPPQYIPEAINQYIQRSLPHTKCVVWDSFDEKNSRSYFVICNENRKIFFNDQGQVTGEISLVQKNKKANLL